MEKEKNKSSWEPASSWYNKSVGEKGHYYHRNVIIPQLLKLMKNQGFKGPLLDLACGQGILSRHIPASVSYTGLDISPSLIKAAKSYQSRENHTFLVKDIEQPFLLEKDTFCTATIILAIQNIKEPYKVFSELYSCLKTGSSFFIVMNHPYFRIPRQTSWEVDERKKIQYRRVDAYMSSLTIPIQTHPGLSSSIQTISFHYPLSAYSKWLKEAGFMIEEIHEWCSDKKSEGAKAKMEDKSRSEFPLFMCLQVKKINKSHVIKDSFK
ncbi:MAG: class I SAM-dependent methyltransferase [Rhabdochlamydiaceae bacterium]